MREVGTGLSWREGKCAGNCCGISEIRVDLVFRGANDQCSHNTNEISPLRAELVFRDVPGKLVEGRGQSQPFGCFGLRRRAPVDAPCDGIAGVLMTPVCLGLLTARRLAVGIAAGSLPTSHSRIRPEPPATDGARSLPGLGHRDDLSSSSRLRPPRGRWDQFRMPGSFLASRAGSVLESAEGIYAAETVLPALHNCSGICGRYASADRVRGGKRKPERGSMGSRRDSFRVADSALARNRVDVS